MMNRRTRGQYPPAPPNKVPDIVRAFYLELMMEFVDDGVAFAFGDKVSIDRKGDGVGDY